MLRRTIALVCLLAALVPVAAAAASAKTPPRRVTVMTRNLFLGTDLLPLAAAAPGAPFQHAVAHAVASLEGTGPAARMRLVAREIAAARPDLVGLQEASVWRITSHGKTRVVADYLRTISAELRRLHAPYRIVARRLSLHLKGSSGPGSVVSFDDGNAVLVRAGVRVSNVRSADFAHELTISTQTLGNVVVSRSWIALDAAVGRARFRFVDTHLEAYSASVRLQQAQDLVAGPLKSKRTTILVGDLNSNANLPKPEDRPPFLAIRGAGYTDERTPRPNCCFNDDLRTGAWDHIVDHIMSRPKVKLLRSFLTGREKTRAGRHPSDHGGVVSVLGL